MSAKRTSPTSKTPNKLAQVNEDDAEAKKKILRGKSKVAQDSGAPSSTLTTPTKFDEKKFTKFLKDNFVLAQNHAEGLNSELNSIIKQAEKKNITLKIAHFLVTNMTNVIRKAAESLGEVEATLAQEFNREFGGEECQLNGYGVDNGEHLPSISENGSADDGDGPSEDEEAVEKARADIDKLIHGQVTSDDPLETLEEHNSIQDMFESPSKSSTKTAPTSTTSDKKPAPLPLEDSDIIILDSDEEDEERKETKSKAKNPPKSTGSSKNNKVEKVAKPEPKEEEKEAEDEETLPEGTTESESDPEPEEKVKEPSPKVSHKNKGSELPAPIPSKNDKKKKDSVFTDSEEEDNVRPKRVVANGRAKVAEVNKGKKKEKVKYAEISDDSDDEKAKKKNTRSTRRAPRGKGKIESESESEEDEDKGARNGKGRAKGKKEEPKKKEIELSDDSDFERPKSKKKDNPTASTSTASKSKNITKSKDQVTTLKKCVVSIAPIPKELLKKLEKGIPVKPSELPDIDQPDSPLIRIRTDIIESDSDDSGAGGKKKSQNPLKKKSPVKVEEVELDSDDSGPKIRSTRAGKRGRVVLTQSDSDGSPKKSKKKTKKVSEDEEDDVKSDALSSASPSGSDYEDDEEEEKAKKKKGGKRAKKGEGKKKFKRVRRFKDSSESGSDEDEDDGPKKKKKKKKVDDSDDELNEDGTKKGRKEIRGMISKKELTKDTKNAEKDEEDRKKRLGEFQKMYNGLFEEPGSAGMEKLVLDFDVKTKEPLVEVEPSLVAKLKPHQAKGIMFMWKSCFDTLKEYEKDPENGGGGAILAHCMGLGKTLQSIAFLYTIMTNPVMEKTLKRALVICPLNTVGNWAKEFRDWLDDQDEYIPVHNLWEGQGPRGKADFVKDWMKGNGIGIIHYDAFRSLAMGTGKMNKKLKTLFREAFVDPGPGIVICDEGHLLKNEKSLSSKAVNQIKTRKRIVLTGTPLQNNLIEYHTMMSFVKPNLLGTLKEFRNRFVNPITNGQHKDSTDRDVKIMKRRAHVLHKLLDGCVQRLDYSVLMPYLPPKQEFVLMIKMSEMQQKLYKHYLHNIAKIRTTEDIQERMKERGGFFADYQTLLKISTHPFLLTCMKEKEVNSDAYDSEGSLKDFIDDGSTTPEDGDSESESEIVKKPIVNSTRRTRSNKEPLEETFEELMEKSQEIGPPKWWEEFFPEGEESLHKIELSGKLQILAEILRKSIEIGDKILVFSQYLTTLDIIEEFLPQVELADGGEWKKNVDYFRIDGSVKTETRHKNLETFNYDHEASKAKLFLISTRAGGLGINVVGANRVVIFDVSWNPSQDLQSIFRVYRFGQKKPVYIYRLVSDMAMEEKVYNRQVVKLSLASRVVDEHQIERHFKYDDMYQMYEFNPEAERPAVTPIFPANDKMLADIIISQKDWIYNILEHDSLLENKQDEELNEDERKEAWDEYQREKDRPALMLQMQQQQMLQLQQQRQNYQYATNQQNQSINYNVKAMQFNNFRESIQRAQAQNGLVIDAATLNRYANEAHSEALKLNQIDNVLATSVNSLQPQVINQLLVAKMNAQANVNHFLMTGIPRSLANQLTQLKQNPQLPGLTIQKTYGNSAVQGAPKPRGIIITRPQNTMVQNAGPSILSTSRQSNPPPLLQLRSPILNPGGSGPSKPLTASEMIRQLHQNQQKDK